MVEATGSRQATRLGPDDIRHLCGDLADWKVRAILDTGAGNDDVETAIAWAAGEDDVMGAQRRPLTGAAAAVYDILTADDEFDDSDRSR